MERPNNVIIFGRDNCEWCDKAIKLLEEKGVVYEYHTLKTVPIIISGGTVIGGYTDMEALLGE